MADTEDFSTLKERAKKKLERDMGPLLLGALNDPRTVEIMLNADGKLWQERLGEKMKCIGSLRVAQSEAIIKTIAGYHGKEVTRGKPILEGELPLDGSRFAGQLPRWCLRPRLQSARRPWPSSRWSNTSRPAP